jgi:hypothetical protein
MKQVNGGSSVLIKVLGAIIAGLALASFNKAVLVLNGDLVERTYRTRALAEFQERFGSVPTAVVCVLVEASLMFFAVKVWRSSRR